MESMVMVSAISTEGCRELLGIGDMGKERTSLSTPMMAKASTAWAPIARDGQGSSSGSGYQLFSIMVTNGEGYHQMRLSHECCTLGFPITLLLLWVMRQARRLAPIMASLGQLDQANSSGHAMASLG
ncbi:hypothetical protein GOBAR_AA26795 [Gossypium barbadense]|uniref:Uncharacterized protein n=1 Tax=Gossypium barbadense TaxID=3634 RepID=A0A2P5WS45_GOSBA|nr:hypothetical protein GOBAR_AA26795 [Gossypium barbadense]